MARYLLDTNVLVRIADIGDKDHLIASDAVAKLLADGNEFLVATQNIIEFWSIGTRPTNVNGVGWDPARVGTEVKILLAQFPLLAESPHILHTWLDVVSRYSVSGTVAHDARLAALMLIQGVPNILTFNVADFRRFTEIRSVHPRDILQNLHP